MFFHIKIKKLKNKIKLLYKMTGKLNLYVAIIEEPKKERIKEELDEIRKLLDEIFLEIK